MNNSYVSRDEARQHDMAGGYRYWFGFPVFAKNLPYSYKQFPAGWYISSAEDLAHFMIMHMNNGVYGGQTLVSAEGMKELHKPALSGYAMGWVVEGSLVSHNGGVPDYGSGLYFDTRTGYGVVVLFNANTGYFYSPSYVIAPSVLRMLKGEAPIQPYPDPTYRSMVIQLGVALGVQVTWLVASVLVLKHWKANDRKRPKIIGKVAWIVLPLLIEAVIAYFILYTLTADGRVILVDFVYLPDMTILAGVSFFLALGWGLVRTLLSMKIFSGRSTQGT
jgi:hypothetical protein